MRYNACSEIGPLWVILPSGAFGPGLKGGVTQRAIDTLAAVLRPGPLPG